MIFHPGDIFVLNCEGYTDMTPGQIAEFANNLSSLGVEVVFIKDHDQAVERALHPVLHIQPAEPQPTPPTPENALPTDMGFYLDSWSDLWAVDAYGALKFIAYADGSKVDDNATVKPEDFTPFTRVELVA